MYFKHAFCSGCRGDRFRWAKWRASDSFVFLCLLAKLRITLPKMSPSDWISQMFTPAVLNEFLASNKYFGERRLYCVSSVLKYLKMLYRVMADQGFLILYHDTGL